MAAYRLIGYENRRLKAREFDDDTRDAGEIGAGHSVTALYELVPPGPAKRGTAPATLKYQTRRQTKASPDLMTVKVRYKPPTASTSRLIEVPLIGPRLDRASPQLQFASAVAAFGLLLRGSSYKGDATYERVLELAEAGKGRDERGYRAEFIRLVKTAKALSVVDAGSNPGEGR